MPNAAYRYALEGLRSKERFDRYQSVTKESKVAIKKRQNKRTQFSNRNRIVIDEAKYIGSMLKQTKSELDSQVIII